MELQNPQNCWGFPHSATEGASWGTATVLAAALRPCPSERWSWAMATNAAGLQHPSKGILAHSLPFVPKQL